MDSTSKGLHFKCPLCGKISWYEMSIDSFTRATENKNEIIIGRCMECGRQWAKYAYVVFGGDTDSCESV